MVSTSKDYVLTPFLFARLKTLVEKQSEKLACNRCGKPFQIGDEVHVKPVRRKRKPAVARRYHKKCWESMFY